MMAIKHGAKIKDAPRGTPPKSVASKYSSPGKNAPEQSGQNRGGDWNKAKTKHNKKKKKDKVKKSFEQYYSGRGAGVIVRDSDHKVLVGQGNDGTWQTPGGHVDRGEDFDEAAHRELREEAGIVADNVTEIGHFKMNGNDSKVFVVDSFQGKVKDSDELKDLKFVELGSLLDWDLRDCSRKGLEIYAHSSLKKSNNLKDMIILEKLEKNIMRGGVKSDVVYDVSHGEALRLVGNGCFRWLKRSVDGMGDEDFRDVTLDGYTISIRRHATDVYSGRINDGHKTIHQFTNKSLPQLCADVMSVFEWYSDEDEHVFDILDEENLSDDAISGGLNNLSDKYKKHNLANIYTEMNNVRQEIRQGNAVDLQQVEQKIMKLFDKLEDSVHEIAGQHNKLARDAGSEVTQLESKLRELQIKVDELNSKPTTVEAYQARPVSSDKIHSDHYMYLPKPTIKIGAHGNITITFEKDWTDMEKSNFLNDMKAKIVKNKRI
jgi:ADP-ribose pyrophosphatase YjhB (NUDIX family)